MDNIVPLVPTAAKQSSITNPDKDMTARLQEALKDTLPVHHELCVRIFEYICLAVDNYERDHFHKR